MGYTHFTKLSADELAIGQAGSEVNINTTLISGGNTILSGSDTWDAASIADGDMESVDVTVTGAALGDFVLVSLGVDTEDLGLVGAVTAADTVTVTLLNNTGGAVDLASTTVSVKVIPA